MIRLLPVAKMAATARYLWANRRRGQGIYPFYASLKVTDRCRYHCSFCNVWRQPARDLDTEGLVRVLRNLGRSSVVLTSLEGGEPLLRQDIEALLQEAHRQPFYLLFTTSVRNLAEYPLERYSRWIDFLHLSIDEGHGNLEMFKLLPDLVGLPWIVCVQTVVRRDDLEALAGKVETCYRAGAKILVMPAVELDGAEHRFPDPAAFRREVLALKDRFPRTVLTPRRYLDALNGASGCSAASIIIDSDGGLFYPCRTLVEKPVNLAETDLLEYLESPDAEQRRQAMKTCPRRCGWYQYFAIDFFTSPGEVVESLEPYWGEFLRRRKGSFPRGGAHEPLDLR
ncbi:MAG: radical SAM protein [Candidatus Zixiibacteriota bacterium]|nr:MAG: radical SAM protein [candidate division Zixibacteria bacterium]